MGDSAAPALLDTLYLRRTIATPRGVLGEMQTPDGLRLCFTLEEPWRENQRLISCIPPGTYPLRHHWSRRLGECFAVDDVPNRDFIRIHIGNDLTDTEGCPLVGLTRALNGQEHRLLLSRAALEVLLKRTTPKGTLIVTDPGRADGET